MFLENDWMLKCAENIGKGYNGERESVKLVAKALTFTLVGVSIENEALLHFVVRSYNSEKVIKFGDWRLLKKLGGVKTENNGEVNTKYLST